MEDAKTETDKRESANVENVDNLPQLEPAETHCIMIPSEAVVSKGTKSSKIINESKESEVHDKFQKDQKDKETIDQLKNQLEMLMNSLATLSAEKSKMEANFQIDKKQLRGEREECEKVVKELREKLKKAQTHNYTEIEQVKCKLIMERHEREKEQAKHTERMNDLQKQLIEERRIKEHLEGQVKTQFANKTQCKILEAELEIMRNKLKQAEDAAKETPPLLVSLQTEMAAMKKQHRNAIHEEQKRAASAEQRARALAMTHEARVAWLEARLAELSEIVGGYDRLRQQDQQAIQKLKDQLSGIQDVDQRTGPDNPKADNKPEEIISKIKQLYSRLLDLDNKKSSSIYVKSLLNSLDLCDKYKNSEYKEKYETLLQDFEDLKQQKCQHNVRNVSHTLQCQNEHLAESRDKSNSKTQLHLLKTHNSNLEERIRMLHHEMTTKEKELQQEFEQHQQKLLQEERVKMEQVLTQKETVFRRKISTLEQELLRQRERSIVLVEEKDKEILRLKTSIHSLLPNKELGLPAESKLNLTKRENTTEPITDLVTGLLNNESPPILHYSQELARKEVQVSALRKRILEMEATLREKQRDIVHMKEKQKEDTKSLQSQITRLEACKSREGANLEYLKNVFINYLTTNDMSSKRHMLNAISTVLRFTPDELNKIRLPNLTTQVDSVLCKEH